MKTRKTEVIEDLHGTRVADPYRWLEDGEASEVKTWTAAQNVRTRQAIDAIPGGARLRAQIRGLLEVGFVSAPSIRTTRGGARRYFHTKREGSQNQPILYVRDGAFGASRVLIDAETLSADGTTALDWWYPSWDGALCAWGQSESGSEESTLFVRDVDTGVDLADRIPHTMHASVAWLPDGSGFYYSRYPAPGSVPPGDEQYYAKLFFHRLGEDPARDREVFGEGRAKTDIPSVSLSPNGRWLVTRVHEGWDKSEIYVRDRAAGEESPWVPVATGSRALFDPIARDDRLYMLTNEGAARYCLMAADYSAPTRDRWTCVLPEAPDVLDGVAILAETIVATYMHEASTRIERFSRGGASLGPIPLPALGSAGVAGAWDGEEVFVNFTSFVAPYEVTRFDLRTGNSELWDRVGVGFSAPAVDVSLVHAVSKDGTRVPMFIVRKPGAAPAPSAAVLYGYGGFNVNQTPAFSARALLTVERGGVWVTAVLRGGGELGEEWHRAGMLEQKQNVFDDFIACAEELVRRNITTADRLGVMGGSNGGLLVAAVVTQRPELFRVGLALVPLTDMLRYHLFRIGKLWIPEYGSADDASSFPFLHAYSPYHAVIDGTRYPAMLFATAESDSRVDPMHARKMSARMQEAQSSATDRPILLRVESKAGHGQGKPVTKLVEELADELLFMFHALGLPTE